jgi:hypothetical protein
MYYEEGRKGNTMSNMIISLLIEREKYLKGREKHLEYLLLLL